MCVDPGLGVKAVTGRASFVADSAATCSMLPPTRQYLLVTCVSMCFSMPLAGAVFLGLDNFYYTASALGLASAKPVSVNSLEGAAKKLCSKGYKDVRSQLQKQPGIKDPDVFVSKVSQVATCQVSVYTCAW